MSPECLRRGDYVRSEYGMIIDRVRYHRRRMSRQEGREVSHNEAKADYIRWLLEGNAKRFKRFFCAHCDARNRCGWEKEHEANRA